MMQWLVSEVVLPFVAVVLTGAILWAATRFTAWTGIQIEAKHREALHSALMTGVRMALSKFGPGAQQIVIKEAVAYAYTSVPGALKKLNPPDQVLGDIAQAKLEEVKAQKGL